MIKFKENLEKIGKKLGFSIDDHFDGIKYVIEEFVKKIDSDGAVLLAFTQGFVFKDVMNILVNIP